MRLAWVWVGMAAAVVAAVLAAVWWHSGETTAGTLATVVAAVLAVTGPLATWLPVRAGAAAGARDAVLERLAAVVRLQWEEEANYRQLHDPQPIGLRWTAADPSLMDHGEVIAGDRPGRSGSRSRPRPLPLAARLDEVVEAFGKLARRRLVVIGEPGAGKTAVLVLLTLGLLERRQTAAPVPLLLSLGSWDPERTAFLDWLVEHLTDEYPFVRPETARAIVRDGSVLPLLDGLDELPSRVAAAAVQRINAAGLERPIVVACRTLEFAEVVRAADVVTGAAVVELEPVAPAQAVTYLRLTTPPDDRLGRWEPVFAELRRGSDSPVAAALATPLMVTLARTVYALDRRADPAELVALGLTSGREAIEDRLLDAVIPALFGTDRSRWRADRARAWLAFLARHLDRSRTRDLAWWELASAGAPRQIARGLGLGLVCGVAAGLLAELATDLAQGAGVIPGNEILVGLGLGLWSSLLAGTGSGVAVGLGLVRRRHAHRPSRLVLRGDPFFRRRLVTGLVVGMLSVVAIVFSVLLLIALPGGAGFAPGLGPSDVLAAVVGVALIVGLPLGLGLGLVLGLVRPADEPPAPGSSLGSDRLATLFAAAMVSVAFVLVAGIATGRGGGVASIPGGVALGLICGVPLALGVAAARPWAAYRLAHLSLAVRGRLPWRLFAFLADAHRLGVLRQAGAVYQFRHARLQDHLARGAPATSAILKQSL
jgi:hypothetical protein